MEAIIMDNRLSRLVEHRFGIGDDCDFETPMEFMKWIENTYGVPTEISRRFYQLAPDMFLRIDTRPQFRVGMIVRSNNNISPRRLERGRIKALNIDGFFNYYIVEANGQEMYFREKDLIQVELYY